MTTFLTVVVALALLIIATCATLGVRSIRRELRHRKKEEAEMNEVLAFLFNPKSVKPNEPAPQYLTTPDGQSFYCNGRPVSPNSLAGKTITIASEETS